MKLRALALIGFVGCASAHATEPPRVVLPQPTTVDDAPRAKLATCEPEALAPVGVEESGALDLTALQEALVRARDFAEQCCNGDESGTALVKVTVGPIGYDTQIDIEPDDLARGPTGSCLHGSFHRVTTRAFRGEALTVPVTVRVKP